MKRRKPKMSEGKVLSEFKQGKLGKSKPKKARASKDMSTEAFEKKYGNREL
jgi:hypothetical protein